MIPGRDIYTQLYLLYDSSLRNEESIFELLLLSFFSRVQGRLLQYDIFVPRLTHDIY